MLWGPVPVRGTCIVFLRHALPQSRPGEPQSFPNYLSPRVKRCGRGRVGSACERMVSAFVQSSTPSVVGAVGTNGIRIGVWR